MVFLQVNFEFSVTMYFWCSVNISLDIKEETHNGFIQALLPLSLLFRFISGLQISFCFKAKACFPLLL